MRLVVSLPDQTYPTLVKNFQVTILTPVCLCSLQTWDLPAAETFSTTVKKDPSDTFTITMATINEASKTASPKIRACYKQGGPGCQSTTTITKLVEYDANVAADQRQMPAFMTRNGAALTVSATDNAQAKAYTMEVTHSTPDNGD